MLGKKTKPVIEDPIRSKATTRLSRLPSIEVMNWADNVGTGVAKALDDYRRTSSVEALEEALQGASMLAGAVDVLLSRHS